MWDTMWETLPPEIWHHIAFTTTILTPSDIRSMACTCSTLHHYLEDTYAKDMTAALLPLSANIARDAFRAIRFSLLLRHVDRYEAGLALLRRAGQTPLSSVDALNALIAAICTAVQSWGYGPERTPYEWEEGLKTINAVEPYLGPDGWRRLRTAVFRSKWKHGPLPIKACVGLLVAQGGDPEMVQSVADVVGGGATGWRGWGLLHAASLGGNVAGLGALLDRPDVDVNVRAQKDITPLHVASEAGHVGCVVALLASPDIKVSLRSESGATPLFLACESGHADVVRLFLDHVSGDSNKRRWLINKPSHSGRAPLYAAAARNYVEIVAILLACPEIQIDVQSNPLGIACSMGYDAIVRLLLDVDGIDINVRKGMHYSAQTPLCMAICMKRTSLVSLLLATPGIQIEKGRLDGASPLMVACETGHVEIVTKLLQHPDMSVDRVNTAGGDGSTPLYVACKLGWTHVVCALLRVEGIALNPQTAYAGRSPLYIAAAKGHAEIVEALLLHPSDSVDVNIARSNGATPLFVACQTGRPRIVAALLATGKVDVNAGLRDSRTALYVASTTADTEGYADVCALLLGTGEVEMGLRCNRRSIVVAREKGFEGVVGVLAPYFTQ